MLGLPYIISFVADYSFSARSNFMRISRDFSPRHIGALSGYRHAERPILSGATAELTKRPQAHVSFCHFVPRSTLHYSRFGLIACRLRLRYWPPPRVPQCLTHLRRGLAGRSRVALAPFALAHANLYWPTVAVGQARLPAMPDSGPRPKATLEPKRPVPFFPADAQAHFQPPSARARCRPSETPPPEEPPPD